MAVGFFGKLFLKNNKAYKTIDSVTPNIKIRNEESKKLFEKIKKNKSKGDK